MKSQEAIRIGDTVFWRNEENRVCEGIVDDISREGTISVRSGVKLHEFLTAKNLVNFLSDLPEVNKSKEKKAEVDPTNPNYYKSGKYEIFDVLMDWIEAEKLDGQEAALIFNTVKYLRRFKSKHPDDKTVDLKKAKWYLDKLISYEAGDGHDGGAVS